LNIFVGENNSGKTSVFIAVARLINHIWSKQQGSFSPGDVRQSHLSLDSLSVTCTFSLEGNDKQRIVDLFSPKDFDADTKRLLRDQLATRDILDNLEFTVEWSPNSKKTLMKLGPLYVHPDHGMTYSPNPSGQQVSLDEVAQSLVSSENSEVYEKLMNGQTMWGTNVLKKTILAILQPKFSYFSEYRSRPGMRERTPLLESLEGSQTASVLLNLKNHTDRRQRDRYTGIKRAFSSFVPQLEIEAVETAPGSNIADIQFREVGDSITVPMDNVGAGVMELLTLITNLATLGRYIFVIEEPELHLHPHMKRNLAAFIRRSSRRNQVFVITHDPTFIDPDFILNLNRFYWIGKKTGTLVSSVSRNLSTKDIGQIKTASKDIIKRELYFARAVLFVEDESQQRFIEGCSKKLQIGLDNRGISIIEVGGKDGFKPYVRLAEQLDIPFLCLADLPWSSSPDKPSSIYRSLGCELEQYLEQANCGPLMDEARQAVGTSKQRVAKYCGENIEVSSIPDFFRQLLRDLGNLCKKHYKKK